MHMQFYTIHMHYDVLLIVFQKRVICTGRKKILRGLLKVQEVTFHLPLDHILLRDYNIFHSFSV